MPQVDTHCPYCAYQCGMLVGDGTADSPAAVQGDPYFPVNNGQLCIKGWTSTTLLRHPERLTTPLVRSGSELTPASMTKLDPEIAAPTMIIQRGPNRSVKRPMATPSRPGSRVPIV